MLRHITECNCQVPIFLADIRMIILAEMLIRLFRGKKNLQRKTKGEKSRKVEFSHKDYFHVKCNCHINFYFKASISRSRLFSRFISQPKIQLNVMADLCFICDKQFSESDKQMLCAAYRLWKLKVLQEMVETEYLNTFNSVNVHTECRKKKLVKILLQRRSDGKKKTTLVIIKSTS